MRFPFRIGLGGTGGLTPWSVLMWYRGSIPLSASANATSRYLHEVDLGAAAGSVTITLPATGPDPTYVGVVNASTVANGSKVVIIQTAAAVEVVRLSAAGESVWLGRNPVTGAWEQLAHDNPSEYQWAWASAAERLAAQVSGEQVGRIGFQSDIGLPYTLLSQAAGVGTWAGGPDPRMTLERSIQNSNAAAAFLATGLAPAFTFGSAVGMVVTPTNNATSMQRTLQRSAAGAGSITVYRSSGSACNYTSAGLRYEFNFTVEEVTANMRWFVGLSLNAIASNLDPATLGNIVGIGRSSSADANVQLYNNDAAGTATKTDLGASYPAATAVTGYRFRLYTVAGAQWGWALKNLNTGAEISGTIGADIPTAASILLWHLYSSNGADAVAVALGLSTLRSWQPAY